MIKFSTPSKKDFLKFVNKFNEVLGDKLALLTKKNFKQVINDLIYDRRFVITIGITLLSIFAHLSTPAFYQDKWVLSKIKKQLENEFKINFILPKKVSYSMFPVPSFRLKDVIVSKNENEIGKIENMVLNLTFSKFLNKEKINIQNIKIDNSQFTFLSKDILNFLDFFEKKINKKKLFIKKSSIFFQDTDGEIYLIIQIGESISFFDELKQENELTIKGEIYNTPFNFYLNNNMYKVSKFRFELPKLDLEFINELNYLNKDNIGSLQIISSLKNYKTNYEFNEKFLNFESNNDKDNNYFYDGSIELKPFNANVQIKYKDLDLLELFSNKNLFYEIIRSNILINDNLNYDVTLEAQNIKNHKKLHSLNLKMNFSQGFLNFNNSTLMFRDTAKLELIDGVYIKSLNEESFYGNLKINIIDEKKFYSFLQTNKKYRKNINNLRISFKFDYKKNELILDEIFIDNATSSKLKRVMNSFNSENKGFNNLIDIKKLINQVFKTL